ncbi:type III pantothenate kinase [Spiroplasma endosymbiont of Polydrusus pterygomalis]|uniref:type III pantothenate kinase n=1 Tax=Spiroplasma endosymbiont of Polydrusus pterygomalis TaxID=3139327 RepID=UPI003CCB3848
MKNLLLVDIGNTLIKIAMINNSEIIKEWPIIETKSKNTIEQLKRAFKLNQKLYFEAAIISCVVPKFLIIIKQLIITTYKLKPLIIDFNLLTSLPLQLNLENQQLGSDLIALSYAAYTKYHNAIVVSLGTATTYSIIINNVLVGIIIGPGFGTSKDALIANAALLSNFEIKNYQSMLGKNTNHALSIGYGYGFSAMINGIVMKIHNEININNLPVILTGGSVPILKSYFDFSYIYEPQMLFLGLIAIVNTLETNKKAT